MIQQIPIDPPITTSDGPVYFAQLPDGTWGVWQPDTDRWVPVPKEHE